MTARTDRRHRIQRYPIPMVEDAIRSNVYGLDNQTIMRDLFVYNRTYESVADSYGLSVRGLYSRVGKIAPSV